MLAPYSNNIDRHQLAKALQGTTTLGLVVKDGVVLVADKRATTGFYIAHKKVKKILKIDDRVALTTAGLVADAQFLASYLKYEAQNYKLSTGKPIHIRTLASTLSLILNSSKFFPYIVQLLLGGYDAYEGPKLFAIEWFGDLTEEKYTATGSGSPVALGVIESEYRYDLRIEDAVKLGLKALTSALKRDPWSGEGYDVAVITKEGIREFTFKHPVDINKLSLRP